MRNFILILIGVLFLTAEAIPQWFFQTCPTNQILNSIYVVNANTIYVAGDNEIILKTTNAGANWIILRENSLGVDFNGIWFFNENTGIVAGGVYATSKTGKILRTTNGGNNWDSLIINGNCFRALYFINSNTGFAGGWINSLTSSPIYKTTNGGLSWNLTSPINSYGVEDFYFINDNTGWATGDGSLNEIVIKTTNGGNDWNIISSSFSGVWLCSVVFVNTNTGWITGNQSSPWGGLLRKTTDGGITWVQQVNHNHNELYEPFFLNENTGWVAGDQPAIQKTTNGGINWNIQTYPQVNWMWDITFLDENTGWAVGAGKIFHTTNSGGPISVQNISSEVPSSFLLYQNYPNPFNPTTKIRFEIPLRKGGEGVVSLKIYDITGREIQTLVNEKLNTGTYEVLFDGSNSASGIYFYRLNAGDFSQTKKLILLK
jgi:photosystem II stability/assembly factor-like uncharacterized protein